MEGKVIIILGATGGIGSGLAKAFSEAGAKLILASRTKEKLEALAKSLPGPSIIVPTDATDALAVRALFSRATRAFSRVDAIVNSTGTWQQVDIDTPLEEAVKNAREDAEQHYIVPFIVIMSGQKFFREHGGGLIVNISSHAAVRPELPGNLTYGPAKAAAWHLAQAVRKELGEGNIRVTDLKPAIVNTPKNEKSLGSEEKRAAAVQPEDIAKWIIEHFDDPDIPATHLFDSTVVV